MSDTTQQSPQEAMPAVASRNYWNSLWAIGLIILSIAYLITEVAFNTELLHVASDINANAAAIEQIELFGRALSGAGAAILLLGVLHKVTRSILILVLSAGIVWSGMFYGQKYLIDSIFIDPSSWEDRLAAKQVALLKIGLAENMVRIEGADFDPNASASPEEKTFLALIGGLVMTSPAFIEHARDQQTAIIHKIAEKTGFEKAQSLYPEYLKTGQRFERNYQRYREASKTYDKAFREAPAEADKRWADTFSKVAKGWLEYQQGMEDFYTQVYRDAPGFMKQYRRFRDARRRCRTESCLIDRDRRYAAEMVRHFGEQYRNLPTDYWCEPSAIKDIVDGVNDFLRGLSRLSTNVETCEVRDQRAMTDKLVALKHAEFEKRSGGYPFGIASKSEFTDHPNTTARIVRELREEGIQLLPDWTTKDGKGFVQAVTLHIRLKALSQWNRDVKAKIGAEVPPKLGYKQFIAHKAVQKLIQGEMGGNYVDGLDFEMSEAQFKARVIDPQTVRVIEGELNKMERDAASFADGQPLEDEGKGYIRAALVPPIALFFSLFFGLLTLAKLGYTLTAALVDNKLGRRILPRWGIVAVKGLLVVGLALALLAPPFLIENKFTQGDAFAYFMDAASQSASVPEKVFAQYAIRMQPVAHPVGQAVLERLEAVRLAEGFPDFEF